MNVGYVGSVIDDPNLPTVMLKDFPENERQSEL